MEVSDQDLVERYLRGDAEALAVLVEKYRRSLFGFIAGMTSGQEDAEEVFQEVWFRVIRKVGKYKHKNFSGWLVRIAHNLVIDRARRRRGMVTVDGSKDEDGPGGIDLPALTPDPGQMMQSGELGTRIGMAVESLPKEQREVFLMRTQLDLSFREIAKMQKISINTALARMHYALGKLRLILRSEYEEVAGGSRAKDE
jgi:RNA polymerase sigma-70 factor, ECF subfamily